MGHKVPQSQYFHGLWHSFFFSTVKDGIYIEKTFKGSKIFVPSIPYWFSGVIMFVVINVVKANMQPTIMNTVVTVSVGGIVYLGILLFLKDSFLLDGLEKVLNRIKGK